MHNVSRKLLLAGVLAFGSLTAACGDKVTLPDGNGQGVQLVTVTPQTAQIAIGESIILSGQVTADQASAKTVTWSTSNAAVATVDAAGKVTGVKAGTVSITATSTADASKAASAAITVNAGPVVIQPSISINTVTDSAGNPVQLGNASGQLNVTVNTSGGGLIEVFLSTACTSNTIAAADVVVASQQATSLQPGTVTLSFNTAQLTAANQAKFANGAYCIKTRLTNGANTFVATNTIPLTLNNVNTFRGTVAFVSQTGGPTSAVSDLNGLSYNQGTLTATINPVIFTSSSPVALITGYLTRKGELDNNVPPTGPITFTNLAVTNGTASIVFTDTSLAGVNSIFHYTSLAAGDTLYITSATDAAGNSISVANSAVAVGGASGIRIDNDVPLLAGTTYTVNAPNGYIGAAYTFVSGTTGTPKDTAGTIPGVGRVTSTYYVGPASATGFSSANTCDITGLTVAGSAADLANTQTTLIDRVKVITADGLGNKICADVQATTNLGPSTTFGVDKIAPNVTMVPPTPANAPVGFSSNNGAAANTGYNVQKNFSFIWNDTISGFGNVVTPLNGTLTKNFFTAGTSASTQCVIGTYSATNKTCANVLINPTSTLNTGGNAPPFVVNSIDMTGGLLTSGYYLFSGFVKDLALNSSLPVSRLAAYDAVAPAITGLTQSPAALAITPGTGATSGIGSVTVTGNATDDLDLTSSTGHIVYSPAGFSLPSVAFQSQGGSTFGPNFDPTTVTAASAAVTLPNVYNGLQSVDVAGTIVGNTAPPTAVITVTDVGTNSTPSAPLTIATAVAATNVWVGKTFTVTATNTAPATSQATTTLNVNVSGLASDVAFQSQPFIRVDIYKLNSTTNELIPVSSNSTPSNTLSGLNRTYTYSQTGVALTAAATNTFYVVGVTSTGDAVITNAVSIVNP